MTKEQICIFFGCTMEQLNQQYAANAAEIKTLAEKAKKSGRSKYRGATVIEWEEYQKKYEALAR